VLTLHGGGGMHGYAATFPGRPAADIGGNTGDARGAQISNHWFIGGGADAPSVVLVGLVSRPLGRSDIATGDGRTASQAAAVPSAGGVRYVFGVRAKLPATSASASHVPALTMMRSVPLAGGGEVTRAAAAAAAAAQSGGGAWGASPAPLKADRASIAAACIGGLARSVALESPGADTAQVTGVRTCAGADHLTVLLPLSEHDPALGYKPVVITRRGLLTKLFGPQMETGPSMDKQSETAASNSSGNGASPVRIIGRAWQILIADHVNDRIRPLIIEPIGFSTGIP